MAKELKKCARCAYCIKKQCTHKSNVGIVLQYRKEHEFFIKPLEDLNKNGTCRKYVELSKK